jgi:dTDP-4-amino-4,6-dideoxygalactose transaminase
MVIPFFNYQRQLKTIDREINSAIKNVLKSGQLILGQEVKNFENNFSRYVGVKFGIGVNSGTDAIKIALKALSIKAGDEIITVANTAIPTISAIRETGATPVFCDIKRDYMIDENEIARLINKKTKAILPVHLYGQAANMPAILKIAKKHKLFVVEDCAQAHGTITHSKKAGSFGDIACFSFCPTKNLGAYGDGGMIITANKKIADQCRLLRMYGITKNYSSEYEGYNSRLDEMQAAILSIKLRHLEQWLEKRRAIAKRYLTNIKNQKIILPEVKNMDEHAFHLFVVRVSDRNKFINYLKKNKIGYGIHYPTPIHQQLAYKFLDKKNNKLKNTEEFSEEIISLPIFPELTEKETNYIIKKINEF